MRYEQLCRRKPVRYGPRPGDKPEPPRWTRSIDPIVHSVKINRPSGHYAKVAYHGGYDAEGRRKPDIYR